MLHSHQNIRSNEKLVKSPDVLHLLSDYERNAASHSNLPILSIVDDVKSRAFRNFWYTGYTHFTKLIYCIGVKSAIYKPN